MNTLRSLTLSAVITSMAISCSAPTDYKAYYNEVLQKLSSEENYGRSAYNDGDIKAARTIIDYASDIRDLSPMGDQSLESKLSAFPPYKSPVHPSGNGRWDTQADNDPYLEYLQGFQFGMNVMRGDMSVSIDGKPIRATWDFTAKEYSPSCHGTFQIKEVADEKVTGDGLVDYLNSGAFKGAFAAISWQQYLTLPAHPFERYQPYIGKLDPNKISGVILRDSELFPYFKARSWYVTPVPMLMVTDSAVPVGSSEITLDLDSEYIPEHDSHNVIAYLPGTDITSTKYITFIAHYDHLGLMGRDNLYPGANDNASGAAMLLTLAKYFSENRPDIGIQFIWLDAEEENLLGAFYYCENPVMPLEDIKMLINLDMIADDGDHLATECSPEGMEELQKIMAINQSNGEYSPFDMALQDLSDNSDHYAFSEKGVPAVYFSTEGSYYEHYHSPRDSYENSTDENFDRLFSILTTYVGKTIVE